MHNVAVIGCGVIGLTSALAIQNNLKSVSVTIYTKDVTPNTTSDIAAGLWEPYLLEDTPPESIHRWSKRTYEYLTYLWRSGQAEEAGVSIVPLTYLTDAKNFQPPSWLSTTLGYSTLSADDLDRYSRFLNVELRGGFDYVTFTWAASRFLPYFADKFIRNGGKIVKKIVHDIEELSTYDVIVNCTGLGSGKLLGDGRVKPVRGQIVRVKAPWQYRGLLVDSSKSCYVVPNIDAVILGGTKQLDYNLNVSEVDKANILRDCSVLVPPINSAEIIKHQVGLRPARDKVRLEAEIRGNGKNAVRIVHNYGHGGAGITLSVGCAKEVAQLVEELLQEQCRSKL